MVEYINSNDDAGNLALYGGIAAGAFAGGAALAYRATSPIYKDKKGKSVASDKAAAIADSVVVKDTPTAPIGQSRVQSIASQMRNPLRTASESTMASLVGKATGNNLENLIERKGNMQGVSSALVDYGNSERKALANIGSDLDKAQGILNQNGGFGQSKAVNQLLESSPNSYVTPEMLSKRVDRAANRPVSRSDLELRDMNKYAQLQEHARLRRESKQIAASIPDSHVKLNRSPKGGKFSRVINALT